MITAPDANTILRSMIESARDVWRRLQPGGAGPVSCVAELLDRVEPAGGSSPFDRLATWAAKHGHGLEVVRIEKQPPLIRLTVKRPAL